jgi:uncharacterized Rmd1/YagE family protein
VAVALSTSVTHHFDALAFVEDFPPRRLAEAFPEARPRVHALRFELAGGGEVFLYPFGAVVFHDVDRQAREPVLERLRSAWPGLVTDVVHEDIRVVAEPGSETTVEEGVLHVDELTGERAGVVALTVAQSAATETYERLVDGLFARIRQLVANFERRGSTGLRMRDLHRFIAETITSRLDILSVLHLLDKPDAVWSDPAMDRIYADLRGEFDLGDRYDALTVKLGSVQETLELVIDTARDRRMLLLEIAIVVLILLEIAFALLRIV